jgi:potassium voltage-gated channel Eag-related subfamily H protein 7
MADKVVPEGNGPDKPVATAVNAGQRERQSSTVLKAEALERFKEKHSSTTNLRSSSIDDVATVKEMFEKLQRAKMWTLDPNSGAMKRWDGIMLGLLMFTATVTPYEVAFLETKIDQLFVINRLVDCGFICDMFIQFFLAYVNLEGKTIMDHKLIAKRYLKSWFGVDFVSILPYDMLGLLFNNENVSQLKLLRIVRLLRLLKLLRLIKAARILKRYESQLGVSFAMLALIKFLVLLLTVAHWSACVWYITGAVAEQRGWDCITSPDQCGTGDYTGCVLEQDPHYPDGLGTCVSLVPADSWILAAKLTTMTTM